MYEELYIETASFVRDPAKDTIDRPFAEEYYERTAGRSSRSSLMTRPSGMGVQRVLQR